MLIKEQYTFEINSFYLTWFNFGELFIFHSRVISCDHNKLHIREALPSKNCNHSTTRALVSIEHLNFSHSLSQQLLYISPPVFNHILPTTCYISIAITLTLLITMLTVPTKICTIIYQGLLHNNIIIDPHLLADLSRDKTHFYFSWRWLKQVATLNNGCF